MDEFEKYLLDRIDETDHFLKNATPTALEQFEAAWEVHREELERLLTKYKDTRKQAPRL